MAQLVLERLMREPADVNESRLKDELLSALHAP